MKAVLMQYSKLTKTGKYKEVEIEEIKGKLFHGKSPVPGINKLFEENEFIYVYSESSIQAAKVFLEGTILKNGEPSI